MRNWIQNRIARFLMAFGALLLCVGCDQTKPEAAADNFSGFASEQLSEQIESVSAKLDQSIEDNGQAQTEILAAVRDLSQSVAAMQLTSQYQINELKKVTGKARAKLTSAGDNKDGVATLDVNTAPSARLELDSLDDAADQIQALAKRIDELEKRCQCGKTPVSANAAPAASACYVDANGNTVCPMRAASTVASTSSVSSPVTYSYPATYQSSQFSGNSSGSFSGGCTGTNAAWQSQSYSVQPQTYRRGFFGRMIAN